MLSKAKLKYIKSLQLKKYRKEEQCFIVEGAKSVREVLDSDFEMTLLAATPEFIDQHSRALSGIKAEVVSASESDLTSAGSLQSNQSAVAVVRMKPNTPPAMTPHEVVLVLDDIRDPGNLGTIIRTADWYGIRHIVASAETADLYNPKTIGSSMGSFLRVHLYYTTLIEYLQGRRPVYGAYLEGADVHQSSFDAGGFIVIGNEANGISEEVGQLIQERIMIPRYGEAESLNAAIATAVILDNIARLKK